MEPLPLDEYVKLHRATSLGEFLERVRDPHLLITLAPRRASASTDFTTLKQRGRGEGTTNPLLVPVKKRPNSNPFAMMITVGRSANNDLILPDPDVSKLHCYFYRYHRAWTICDPGSTNGTTLDGVRVRDRGTPLRSGSRVRLGDVYEFLFLEPDDLHGLVSGRVRLAAALGEPSPPT